MQLPEVILAPVFHLSDGIEARRLAKAMVIELGFNIEETEEVGIVVSELASNLVKHATGGHVILTPLKDNGRLGIKIESQDNGSGIADIDQAITDGFSTTDSLGYGLGTVNRLMDDFEIQPRNDGKTGTLVRCLKWKRENLIITKPRLLSFGVATRAYHNLELNGDAFVVRHWNESTLVGLIDGLGHGNYANHSAQVAREYVENHYDQPLEAIYRGVDRACRATRGVVMALAKFDWKTAPIKLSFVSIGNIEARVFGNPNPISFKVQRGVIGLNAPNPIVTDYTWNPEYVLVLHTDGLNAKWHWNDFPELVGIPVGQASQRLLQKLAKDDDDATVIVISKNCMLSGEYR